jgi:hypothetical protein
MSELINFKRGLEKIIESCFPLMPNVDYLKGVSEQYKGLFNTHVDEAASGLKDYFD